MDNPGLPKPLWAELGGRLWHATGRNGFRGILADKEIKVGFGERYRGSFCRCQGCVSLFDFGPAAEDLFTQFNNWSGWFGHQQQARVAVWLEIDRARVLEALIDARAARDQLAELMERRRTEGRTHEPGIQIIPGVEACHKGAIPLASIGGVLLVDQHNRHICCRLAKPNEDTFEQIDVFEAGLPPHNEDTRMRRILEAGKRTAAKRPAD